MNNSNEKEITAVEATVNEESKEVVTNGATVQTTNDSVEESLIVKDENVIKAETAGNTTPNLKRLNEKFMLDVMSVPTASHNEYRMVTFILMFAIANGIDYHMDTYGNIYLTKGQVKEGEYYPCVTAHMDTVQDKQNAYAKIGKPLDIKYRKGTKHNNYQGFNHEGKTEIYVDGFGLGGDDKAGVLICLSMFSYVNKLKACFFLEEEIGCQGSKNLDKEWFDNVGYVIGFDSPELNRAAYCCSGTKLMNKEFFESNGLAELCASYGLNDFRSEPYTDVVQIRDKTEIICMNFGTGYYECHMPTEYCVVEEMDHALDMGVAIIERLGCNQYKMKHIGGGTYGYGSSDSYFESLKPGYKAPSTSPVYQGSGSNYSYNGNSYSGNTSGQTVVHTVGNNKTNYEQVQHVSDVYEAYVVTIKDDVAAKCKENGLNFDELFGEIFSKKVEF